MNSHQPKYITEGDPNNENPRKNLTWIPKKEYTQQITPKIQYKHQAEEDTMHKYVTMLLSLSSFSFLFFFFFIFIFLFFVFFNKCTYDNEQIKPRQET